VFHLDLPEFILIFWRIIMIRKLLAWTLMLGIMAALTACNTIEGAGKDVESGGQHVEDAAKDVKKGR
jgi:predicted small secreted protein